VEAQLVVLVVAEDQLAVVQKVDVPGKAADHEDLEAALHEDLRLVDEENPNYGEEVSGEGFWSLYNFSIVAENAIDDEVEDPNEVVLANENRYQRDEAQPPLALGEVIVKHSSHYRKAGCVSVVEKVKEVDRRC
jgi:hypothetical protein